MKVNKDTKIGDLLNKHPKTEKILKKYFGPGCLTCPGAKIESLKFAATMHDKDINKIVKEINETVK